MKPRSGPKPSPFWRAAATAAAQSGLRPRFEAEIEKVRPAATNATGFASVTRARCWSVFVAWAEDMPPTSTPSMRTPWASVDEEPAYTTATTTTATTSATTAASDSRLMRRTRA